MHSALYHSALISTGLPVRRDHPVADLGVHPCQLNARLAAREQPVLVAADAVPGAGRVMRENVVHTGVKRFDGGGILRVSEIATQGVDVPQRSVHAVVVRRFEVGRCIVGKAIRDHAGVDVPGKGS